MLRLVYIRTHFSIRLPLSSQLTYPQMQEQGSYNDSGYSDDGLYDYDRDDRHGQYGSYHDNRYSEDDAMW